MTQLPTILPETPPPTKWGYSPSPIADIREHLNRIRANHGADWQKMTDDERVAAIVEEMRKSVVRDIVSEGVCRANIHPDDETARREVIEREVARILDESPNPTTPDPTERNDQ